MTERKVFLVHDKTKKEYEVVKFDKGSGVITLRGRHRTFEEVYDKDRFAQMGYSLTQREVEPATED